MASRVALLLLCFGTLSTLRLAAAATLALWLFDEQQGLYPSCLLGDASPGNAPLVLGPGGRIVRGKFGNGLATCDPPPVTYPRESHSSNPANRFAFGIGDPPAGKHALMWRNARFCALMTRGERHLRQEVGFASPTSSSLNLGRSSWTLEYWYLPAPHSEGEGVVLEIGTGPRGTQAPVTRLVLEATRDRFRLEFGDGEERLLIPSNATALQAPQWHHLAFAYDRSRGLLRHFVDGIPQGPALACRLEPLPPGDEDYLSVGRDGQWERPLAGTIDEVRISDKTLYEAQFVPPGTFSRYDADYQPPPLPKGLPLLFGAQADPDLPIALGDRKHLFLDDALIASRRNVEFRPQPPRPAERVLDKLGGHLIVNEDLAGRIRLYVQGPAQSLAVLTSEDGVRFEPPDLGREHHGARNVVIEDPVGLGTIFEDPSAPPAERFKYFSGYRGRGCYVYSSPDGYRFTRNETSAVPFRGASQSIVYYDEQRQRFMGFHRSDMLRSPAGKSLRTFVRTEVEDLMRPWPFEPVLPEQQTALEQRRAIGGRIGTKNPYYIDNGPLTPPGFGLEYPTGFAPDPQLDPVGTDIYVPKMVKYPWAPDAYLAFPVVYFHYHGDGPEARQRLGSPAYGRGSGPLETQLAVSRDGLDWTRYPRPTYIGIGRQDGFDLKRAYIAHGMVRRGEEIWQYYLGEESYHSPWQSGGRKAIFRVVQQFDRFVAAETPYEGGEFVTRPLRFSGNRLLLNLDTDALGYAQIGVLDAQHRPLNGFDVEDSVYINGDFPAAEAEWLQRGRDISSLAGQTVRLVVRSRGTRLYSLQFVQRDGD